jgi:hypothetical protein
VEVKYSDHLQFRMNMRRIPKQMPERIYYDSTQRYYNHHTLRRIAVMEVYYQRRRTLMMIAYDQFPDYAEVITIHTITRQQIREHVEIGRWTYAKSDATL